MSKKEELLALADRIERLSEPCRKADADIVKALYPDAQIGEYVGYEDIVFHAKPLVADKEILPFFTASLDAAMQLVPDGCDWMADSFDGSKSGFRFSAGVYACGGWIDCEAASSAPIAITVAALRSRAALEDA